MLQTLFTSQQTISVRTEVKAKVRLRIHGHRLHRLADHTLKLEKVTAYSSDLGAWGYW